MFYVGSTKVIRGVNAVTQGDQCETVVPAGSGDIVCNVAFSIPAGGTVRPAEFEADRGSGYGDNGNSLLYADFYVKVACDGFLSGRRLQAADYSGTPTPHENQTMWHRIVGSPTVDGSPGLVITDSIPVSVFDRPILAVSAVRYDGSTLIARINGVGGNGTVAEAVDITSRQIRVPGIGDVRRWGGSLGIAPASAFLCTDPPTKPCVWQPGPSHGVVVDLECLVNPRASGCSAYVDSTVALLPYVDVLFGTSFEGPMTGQCAGPATAFIPGPVVAEPVEDEDIVDDGLCVVCAASCATCSFDDPWNCTSCATGCTLVNGSCPAFLCDGEPRPTFESNWLLFALDEMSEPLRVPHGLGTSIVDVQVAVRAVPGSDAAAEWPMQTDATGVTYMSSACRDSLNEGCHRAGIMVAYDTEYVWLLPPDETDGDPEDGRESNTGALAIGGDGIDGPQLFLRQVEVRVRARDQYASAPAWQQDWTSITSKAGTSSTLSWEHECGADVARMRVMMRLPLTATHGGLTFAVSGAQWASTVPDTALAQSAISPAFGGIVAGFDGETVDIYAPSSGSAGVSVLFRDAWRTAKADGTALLIVDEQYSTVEVSAACWTTNDLRGPLWDSGWRNMSTAIQVDTWSPTAVSEVFAAVRSADDSTAWLVSGQRLSANAHITAGHTFFFGEARVVVQGRPVLPLLDGFGDGSDSATSPVQARVVAVPGLLDLRPAGAQLLESSGASLYFSAGYPMEGLVGTAVAELWARDPDELPIAFGLVESSEIAPPGPESVAARDVSTTTILTLHGLSPHVAREALLLSRLQGLEQFAESGSVAATNLDDREVEIVLHGDGDLLPPHSAWVRLVQDDGTASDFVDANDRRLLDVFQILSISSAQGVKTIRLKCPGQALVALLPPNWPVLVLPAGEPVSLPVSTSAVTEPREPRAELHKATGGALHIWIREPLDLGGSAFARAFLSVSSSPDGLDPSTLELETETIDEPVILAPLRANTTYWATIFVESASPCVASGRPAVFKFSTAGQSVPSQPTALRRNGQPGPVAFSVAWDEPVDIGGGESLQFAAQVSGSTGARQWRDIYGSTALDMFITELVPETTYVVRVRGENAAGYGPWSEELIVGTGQLRPPDPLPVVRVSEITGGAATVHWDGEGVFADSFEVEIEQTSTSVTSRRPFCSALGSETSCRGGNLLAGEPYSVQVRPVNIAGAGSLGTNLEFTAGDVSAPGVAINLHVVGVTGGAISFAWSPPLDNGGVGALGLNYIATVADGTSGEEISTSTTDRGEMTVGSLRSVQSYTVTVTTAHMDSDLVGETSLPMAAVTGALSNPDSPHNAVVIEVTGGAATLQWQPPTDSGGLPISVYWVDFYPETGKRQVFRVPGDTNDVTVGPLLLDQPFSASIRAENGGRRIGGIETVHGVAGSEYSLPGAPRALVAETAGEDVATLTITPPIDTGGSTELVYRYVVAAIEFLGDEIDDGEDESSLPAQMELNTAESTVVVDNLLSKIVYLLSVECANTQLGLQYGPPTQSLFVLEPPTGKVRGATLAWISGNCVHLFWQAALPEIERAPAGYTVVIASQDSADGVTTEFVGRNNTVGTVCGLSPLVVYDVDIRVMWDDGTVGESYTVGEAETPEADYIIKHVQTQESFEIDAPPHNSFVRHVIAPQGGSARIDVRFLRFDVECDLDSVEIISMGPAGDDHPEYGDGEADDALNFGSSGDFEILDDPVDDRALNVALWRGGCSRFSFDLNVTRTNGTIAVDVSTDSGVGAGGLEILYSSVPLLVAQSNELDAIDAPTEGQLPPSDQIETSGGALCPVSTGALCGSHGTCQHSQHCECSPGYFGESCTHFAFCDPEVVRNATDSVLSACEALPSQHVLSVSPFGAPDGTGFAGLPFHSGGSPGKPFRTVHAALEAAVALSPVPVSIVVQPGVYLGDSCGGQITSSVEVVAAAGHEHTTIDCSSSGDPFVRVLSEVGCSEGGGLICASAYLEGFAILGGDVEESGGVLQVSNAQATISSLRLTSPRSSGLGGTLYAVSSVVKIADVVIEGSAAGVSGGAVALVENSNLTARGLQIHGGSATDGGALFLSSSSAQCDAGKVCSVREAQAAETGGGVRMQGRSSLEGWRVSECLSQRGGGVAVDATPPSEPATLVQVVLEDNIATTGGGLHLSNTSVWHDSVRLTGNSASNGAGMAVHAAKFLGSGNVSKAYNNVASVEGGALAAFGDVEVSGLHMHENLAPRGGGLSGAPGAEITLGVGVAAVGNVAVATGGGGAYLEDARVTGVAQDPAVFEHNDASSGCGGGLQLAGASAISDVAVTRGVAREGGGVCVLPGAIAQMTHVAIANSTSSAVGGGLLIDIDAVVRAHDVTVTGSQAARGGGAYLSLGSSLLLGRTSEGAETAASVDSVRARTGSGVSVSVFESVAEDDGGGVACDSCSAVNGVDIHSCSAQGHGGGISVKPLQDSTAFGPTVVSMSAVAKCTAPYGGGISIHGEEIAQRDVVWLANTTARSCSAQVGGGGMFANNVILRSSNVSVENNTAISGGGAMFVGVDVMLLRNDSTALSFSHNAADDTAEVVRQTQPPARRLQAATESVVASEATQVTTVVEAEPFAGGAVYATSIAPHEAVSRYEYIRISGDRAAVGGGAYFKDVTTQLHNWVVDGAVAHGVGGGGGIAVVSAAVETFNVTVTRCSALPTPLLPLSGGGGGLVCDSCVLELLQTTVSHNTGSRGGGIDVRDGTLRMHETELCENTATCSSITGVPVDAADGGRTATCGIGAHIVTSGVVVVNGTSRLAAREGQEDVSQTGVPSPLLESAPSSSLVGGTAPAGGALFARAASTVVIDHVLIIDNAATHGAGLGGGVFAAAGSDVTVVAAAFVGNAARLGGGALYSAGTVALRGCYVSQNRVNFRDADDASSGSGGGVASIASTASLLISNCNFVDNSAAAEGGALFVSDSTSCLVNDTEFSYNAARDAGGVVSARYSSCSIAGTRMYRCAAVRGGCVAATVSSLSLEAVIVIEGTAERGGAAWVSETELTVVQSRFLYSKSHNNGGGIEIVGGIATVSESEIIGCRASFDGGGVAVSTGELVLHGCNFSDNDALSRGGAVMVSSLSFLAMDTTTFHNNTALYIGGGVFADRKSVSSVSDARFERNIAGQDGGGLSIFSGEVEVLRCQFIQNEATNGGGIYAPFSTVSTTGCSFHGHRADNGGAVSLPSGGSWTSTDDVLDGNAARELGGAAIVGVGAVVSMVRGSCTGNIAQLGGCSAVSGGELTVVNSNVDGNAASLQGGGFYEEANGLINITDVRVSGNMATTGTQQVGNAAEVGKGGGAFVSSTSRLRAHGVDWSDNHAFVGGAVFYRVSGSLDASSLCSECSLTRNTPHDYGGLVSSVSFTLLANISVQSGVALREHAAPMSTVGVLSVDPFGQVALDDRLTECTVTTTDLSLQLADATALAADGSHADVLAGLGGRVSLGNMRLIGELGRFTLKVQCSRAGAALGASATFEGNVLPCSPGSSLNPARVCTRCPAGSFSTDGSACYPCPPGAECVQQSALDARITEGVTEPISSPGFYMAAAPATKLEACVEMEAERTDECAFGMRRNVHTSNCELAWDIKDVFECRTGYALYQCNREAACAGGVNISIASQGDALDNCVEGSAGPFCDLCLRGWVKSPLGECIQCVGSADGDGGAGVVVLSAGIMTVMFSGAVYFVLRSAAKDVKPSEMSASTAARRAQQRHPKLRLWARTFATELFASEKAKVGISAMQVLSMLGAYGLFWPRSVRTVMSFTAMSHFDLVSVTGFDCIVQSACSLQPAARLSSP